MITFSPCSQLTGAETLCLAVSCSESMTQSWNEIGPSVVSA
jgi:hypothetical protein